MRLDPEDRQAARAMAAAGMSADSIAAVFGISRKRAAHIVSWHGGKPRHTHESPVFAEPPPIIAKSPSYEEVVAAAEMLPELVHDLAPAEPKPPKLRVVNQIGQNEPIK